MVKQKIENIINELNKKFLEKYEDFKGCYLFGSSIKNNYTANSDIDLVAIFEELSWEKDFEISGILCDLMFKYDIYIDLHNYTSEKLKNNPFLFTEVLDKGIFYEAA